jgi:hypothetical protein
MLRRLELGGFTRMAASYGRSYERTWRQVARIFLWTLGAQPLARQAARAAAEAVAPSVVERRRRREVRAGTADWLAPDPVLRGTLEDRAIEAWPAAKGSRYEAVIRRGLDHPHTSQRLEEMWNDSRATGVRLAQPFMDPDLVQFLTRTPPELLNAEGRSKGLVRGRVAQRMPGLGFERQRKIGETGRLRDFARGELRRGWRTLGRPEALAELGVVDMTAFERALDTQLGEGPERPLAPFALDALTLEAWLRPRI